MKVLSISAVLCLAASALAAIPIEQAGSAHNSVKLSGERHHEVEKSSSPSDSHRRPVGMMRHEWLKKHKEHDLEAHSDGPRKENDPEDEEDMDENSDSSNGDFKSKKEAQKGNDAKKVEEHKGTDVAPSPKDEVTSAPGDNKPLDDGKKPTSDPTPANGKDDKGTFVSSDYTSPVWLVQPFGASIWERGVEYVISWGPNPDPSFAKNLADKSPIQIRLMQGPPELLREVKVLATGIDSSLNMFKWKVPLDLPLGKDYSIRLTSGDKLDTYSHYFEISAVGDKRSTKSNVGQPLEKPKVGDVPLPLNSKIAPAPPPNPIPDVKKDPVVAPTTPPTVAKPAVPSDGTEVKSNMLAFALTLFGAVYFL
ncbi:hypothetical protein BGW41_001131 [Actinomortierella wolfii]|nr:hypothetical protein BGW41_001131 [Actinomortierella wolfii]